MKKMLGARQAVAYRLVPRCAYACLSISEEVHIICRLSDKYKGENEKKKHREYSCAITPVQLNAQSPLYFILPRVYIISVDGSTPRLHTNAHHRYVAFLPLLAAEGQKGMESLSSLYAPTKFVLHPPHSPAAPFQPPHSPALSAPKYCLGPRRSDSPPLNDCAKASA
jgi:hypothetical protein